MVNHRALKGHVCGVSTSVDMVSLLASYRMRVVSKESPLLGSGGAR